ncbi:MAG: hypothetical protein ACXABI_02680 [Candidatus Hodarchaeales archaeon]
MIFFSFQPGHRLVQSQSQFSHVMAVEFSGITQNAIEACPWILNLSVHEIIGLNEEFRNYFTNDVKNETALYPNVFDTTKFVFEYSDTRHYFNHSEQVDLSREEFPYKYNTSEFDPYYSTVYLEYRVENTTIRNEYNSTIAPALENRFANKWYIERAEIIIEIAHSADTSLDSTWILVGLVTLTILLKGTKRKLK